MNTSDSKLNQFNKSYFESDLRLSCNNFSTSSVDCYNFQNKKGLIKRTVYMEELIHFDPPVLKRYISDKTLDRSVLRPSELESSFAKKVVLSDIISNSNIPNISFNTQLNSTTLHDGRNYICNNDVIPMDVDEVQELKTEDYLDSRKIENIYTESCTREMPRNFENMLKKRLNKKLEDCVNSPLEEREHEHIKLETELLYITSHKKGYNNIVIVFGLFLLAFLSTLFCLTNFISVNKDIQIEKIKKDLMENVLEQQIAINTVIQSLEERTHWTTKSKVLLFIGSNGVGKTYMANIIKKHFYQDLVHEIYGFQLPYKTEQTKILNSLSSCCLNLIIVDDLKRNNIPDLFTFIYSLPKDQFVLVLSIFNIQYTGDKISYVINSTDVTEIRKDFDNSGIYHEAIIFNDFNNTHVEDWLQTQLKFYNINIDVNEILKTIIEGHNVAYNGLKGVYEKLLLELEKYKD